MPCKKYQQPVLFHGFSIKTSFSMSFDDNMSIIPFFIKQIFCAAEKVPPLPLQCCAGGEVEWLFSSATVSLVIALLCDRYG
jgi:hypothetical protein